LGLTYILIGAPTISRFRLMFRACLSSYSIELNDISMFVASLPGEAFYQAVVDQLISFTRKGPSPGASAGALPHPRIINAPFRHKYLEKALDYITGHDDVWSPPAMRSPRITPPTL
jgi:hypothetical protein